MEIMNVHLTVKVQFLLFVPEHPLSRCDLLSSIKHGASHLHKLPGVQVFPHSML